MNVTLIQDPVFTVQLGEDVIEQPKKDTTSFLKKVSAVGLKVLDTLGKVLNCLHQAASLTLRNSGRSFKNIVLRVPEHRILSLLKIGTLLIPKDFYLLVYKVAYWVFAMGFSIATATVRSAKEKLGYNDRYLKKFTGDEMVLNHLKIQEIKLDVSGVPDAITIEQLMDFFHEVNFTDPQKPGYMPESTRKEEVFEIFGKEVKTYTVEELEKSLRKFITHTTNRIAYVGTPALARISLYLFLTMGATFIYYCDLLICDQFPFPR